MSFGYPNYVDYRDRAQSFDGLACHQSTSFTVVGDPPRRIDGRLVCWNFFSVLGVQPHLGRSFTAADDQAGAPPVALVSDRLWKQHFGGDPSAVGRTLQVGGERRTIVGVMPPEVDRFPAGGADVWTALTFPPLDFAACRAAIARYLADRALRELLAARARDLLISRHTWRDTASRILAALPPAPHQ